MLSIGNVSSISLSSATTPSKCTNDFIKCASVYYCLQPNIFLSFTDPSMKVMSYTMTHKPVFVLFGEVLAKMAHKVWFSVKSVDPQKRHAEAVSLLIQKQQVYLNLIWNNILEWFRPNELRTRRPVLPFKANYRASITIASGVRDI